MMHPSESELPLTSFLGLYGNCSSKNHEYLYANGVDV